MTDRIDPREAKLPVWAQEQMRTLRMRADEAERRFNALFDRPITFAVGRDEIQVRVSNENGHGPELTVMVTRGGALVVRPQSSNVIRVQGAER